MFIPTKENYTEMTPTEFEKYAISVLSEHFEQEGITDYSFEHNVIKKFLMVIIRSTVKSSSK